MLKHRLPTRLLLAVACLSAPLVEQAAAQSATDGAIAVSVTDRQGAYVAGASATIHNNGTGRDMKSVSDAQGYVRVGQLAPGDYTVTVAATSFAGYKADHVRVQVGLVTDVRTQLSLGATEQVVDVSSVGGRSTRRARALRATWARRRSTTCRSTGGAGRTLRC